MKKPDIKTFREVLRRKGGNITKVADFFKVTRGAVYVWAKNDDEFKIAIKDERGVLVDECLLSARVLAIGIPQKDEKGNFIGWIERPDGNMIRYLLSTLGRNEGFGESRDEDASDIPTDIEKGVDIESWIKKEVSGDKNT